MYLSRFGVKNYKCLGDIDIPLTPIHVLIGQNDAGKTSLLEAIAAFLSTGDEQAKVVFRSPSRGFQLLRHGTSSHAIEFAGQWVGDANSDSSRHEPLFRYGFAVDFQEGKSTARVYNEHIKLGTSHQIDLSFRQVASFKSTTVFKRKRGQEIPDSIPPGDLAVATEALESTSIVRLDPRVLAMPSAIDPGKKFHMDPDGFGLPTLMMDISGYDPSRAIDLRNEFCRLFPYFKSVRVESETAMSRDYGSGVPSFKDKGVGYAIYFETTSGATLRANQVSDGVILMLGFLALAHLPKPPNVLLIEEPENGIYPKRLGEVITILKDLVHRTEGVRFPQIIMSTHSPFVLSFFEPEEVTFLSRDPNSAGGPVRARPLREAPNIKERLGDDFYLGELWYNLTEEDLFGEP